MGVKVSVIVPVFNNEKVLERCLKSIKNQTFTDIEVIVINDGSSDNSLQIIEKFLIKDTRFKLRNQENKGVSESRNYGISISKGDYILNVDSDDWIEDDYIEKMYCKAVNNNLDIIISDAIKHTYLNDIFIKDLDIADEKIISGKEYLEIFFKENLNGFTWNKLVKRKLYNNISYPTDISLFEDLYVVSKLANKARRIGKINYPFYHYMESENSLTKMLNISKICDVYNVFIRLKSDFSEDINIREYLCEQEIYALLNTIINSRIQLENHEYRKKLRYLLSCIKNIDVNRTDFRYSKMKRLPYLGYRFLKLFPGIGFILLLVYLKKLVLIKRKVLKWM